MNYEVLPMHCAAHGYDKHLRPMATNSNDKPLYGAQEMMEMKNFDSMIIPYAVYTKIAYMHNALTKDFPLHCIAEQGV